MTAMRVLSADQPHAQLMVTRESCFPDERHGRSAFCNAEMVKRIHTASYPFPYTGERVAIYATKKRPRDVWCSFMRDPEFPPELEPFHGTGRFSDPQESADGEWWRYRWAGPLGAIVGSCRVTASLPIVDGAINGTHTIVNINDQLWDDDGRSCVPIQDQVPFGDFTPGMYAWILEDAAPTTERCPWCMGSGAGEQRTPTSVELLAGSCSVCNGAGHCAPISWVHPGGRLPEWTTT